MWVAIIKQLVNTNIFTVTFCFNILCYQPYYYHDHWILLSNKKLLIFLGNFLFSNLLKNFNCSGKRQDSSVAGPECHTNRGVKPCLSPDTSYTYSVEEH